MTLLFLSGCGGWQYKVSDEVTFEIRSWNHDPIIRTVENADPETFQNMDEDFGKDNERVFYKGDEIIGADPATFEQIYWAYSKDSNSVYLFTCKLENASPSTFQVLKGSWSKDSQNVYHGHQQVEADVTSFYFVDNGWALDKSRAYHALTWVSLGCNDSGHLKVKVFENIDPETFEVIDAFTAKDKNGTYDVLPSPNKSVKLTPITTLRFAVASPLYRKTTLRNGANLPRRYVKPE